MKNHKKVITNLIIKAGKAKNKKNWSEAEIYYAAVLDLAPAHLKASLNRAFINVHLNNVDLVRDSLIYFEQNKKLCLYEKVNKTLKAKEWNLLVKYLTSQNKNNSFNEIYSLGLVLFYSSKFLKAFKTIEQLKDLQGEALYWILCLKGKCRYLKNQRGWANFYFFNATEINRNQAEPFYYLGNIWFLQGLNRKDNDYKYITDFSEASNYYIDAIKTDCNDKLAVYKIFKNKHFLKERKFLSEYTALSKKIKQDSNNADAYYQRAWLCLSKKIKEHSFYKVSIEEMINDFSEVIRIKSDFFKAYRGRGFAWYEYYKEWNIRINEDMDEKFFNEIKSAFDKAIADFNKAFELDTQNPDTYYFIIADLYNNENKINEAIYYINKALLCTSDKVKALMKLCFLYERLSNYNQAISEINNLLKIKPDYYFAYFKRATIKTNLKDYEGAIKDYSTYLEHYPDEPFSLIKRGILKYNLKDYKNAKNDFNKTIENFNKYKYNIFNTGDSELKQRLSGKNEKNNILTDAYFYLSRINYIYENNEAAKYYLKQAINKSSGEEKDNLIYDLARLKFLLKEYKSAYKDISPIIEEYYGPFSKGSMEDFELTADLAYKLKKYREAVFYYDNTIKFFEYKKPVAEIYYKRALAHFELKDYDECVSDLIKALEIKPDYFKACFALANYYFELKEYENAIIYFTRAIKLEPVYYPDLYLSRAEARYNLRQYDEALEDINEILRIKPGYSRALLVRAQIYLKILNFKAAIEDYTQVLHKEPDNFDAFNNRATARHNLKDYNGAIEDYSKAIEITPDKEYLYFNRGLAEYEIEELVPAYRDMCKTVELNPKHIEAYYMGADINMLLNNEIAAIKNYNALIEVIPDLADAYLKRGLLYVKMVNYKAAAADFEKVLALEPKNDEARDYLIAANKFIIDIN